MPLHIEDESTAQFVTRLAELHGITEQEPVRIVVRAELDRAAARPKLRDRFAALRKAYPPPQEMGQAADKAVFDGLSGASR